MVEGGMMIAAAQQLDMFAAPPIVPPLPIARAHPFNHRAFDMSDCHRERHDLGDGVVVTLMIARCADGLLRGTAGYTSKTGGIGGPVFDSDFATDSFHGARVHALLRLRIRVRSAGHEKILKKIESIPLDFWSAPK
jgi:hypothetical protein